MEPRDSYIYPAVFTFEEDQIRIRFPDLPGCLGLAANEEKAFHRARSLLRDWLLQAEQKGNPLPDPTSIAALEAAIKDGKTQSSTVTSCLCLIHVSLAPYREAFNKRAVKKTLTIPAWLNDLAEKEKVNFSFVLQQALKELLVLDQ